MEHLYTGNQQHPCQLSQITWESPVYRPNLPPSRMSHQISQIKQIKAHKMHLSDIFWQILGIWGKFFSYLMEFWDLIGRSLLWTMPFRVKKGKIHDLLNFDLFRFLYPFFQRENFTVRANLVNSFINQWLHQLAKEDIKYPALRVMSDGHFTYT